MKQDRVANAIKVGAVATAIPRWVAALLASEGFALPTEWLSWWVPVSAAMSAAMALVEGLAFMYLFNRWGELRDDPKTGKRLLILAGVAALSFIAVLMPSIAASVRHTSVGAMVTNDLALYAWSIAVAASTISIVVAVGYAQRATFPTEMKVLKPKTEIVVHSNNGYKSKAEHARALAQQYPSWTQGQIAREVGCKTSTVSRALKERR